MQEMIKKYFTYLGLDKLALVVTPPGSSEPYWTDSARELVRALILQVLTLPPDQRDLFTLRQLPFPRAPEGKAAEN